MNKVEIYTTPTCVHCAHAKEFFKQNGVEYSEHNVLSDLAKRQEMVQKSGQMGVPVILVDDEVIVGFNEPRLAELLGVK